MLSFLVLYGSCISYMQVAEEVVQQMANLQPELCFCLSLECQNQKNSTDDHQQDEDNHQNRNNYDHCVEHRNEVSNCIGTIVLL